MQKNGNEAIEMFRQYHKKIDVVICDYDMPEKNGKKVVETIRKTSNVLIIANSSLLAFNKKMIDAGANKFILKPSFNFMEEFNAIIKNFL